MSDGTLRRVKAQFQVSLHPALSETSLAGVEELLNTLLLRFVSLGCYLPLLCVRTCPWNWCLGCAAGFKFTELGAPCTDS